ncbi:sugar phosphate isomerase/epimerase family protein [Serratia quinivorans]|uniref:sugar phosphate isomerase/epimerase family protein n=1 Tax=Serratia quinivorans TaxID=137545 RepID=UPI0021796013|nr:sugar phosphate isomerase/epimerase [Serratia quinivorans]CAI0708240.1 Xylose isomerase-like TIM barrel [Serratia quinivorans]CAI1096809.1 Xylose isomerase-like TIM barrel [Serratia quinivorans]CAI1150427.1 Xylose isomerase-like TIM barrel [Serratia quinivorans]CAI1616762.1 Xylose isomerase-like TIM barrel [Serratia quinivorans]CAI2035996.1 Xylose isomerase-like TIM barrel [Serratia quinivorans]
MDRLTAEKVLLRAQNLPLYLHAYAFHLNMRMEKILPEDLLTIAHQQQLRGVKVHVLDGESQALCHADDARLRKFGEQAQRYGLDIHIETSASDSETIDQAVNIALKSGASSVRFYPRYQGALQEVLARIAVDIQYIKQRYQHSGLSFTLEQHEDLKSHELVSLVRAADFPQLSLLFDFANMINANEEPLAALATMAEDITQVHIKDALIVRENQGMGHRACISGQGDLPFRELLLGLICLGDERPQVTAYGLEEEVDYYAPPFRFNGEGDNPHIPWREMSETALPEQGLEERLKKEYQDALNQIHHVRTITDSLIKQARELLTPA